MMKNPTGRLINLTPHSIKIVGATRVHELDPCLDPARVVVTTVTVGMFAGVEVVASDNTQMVTNLPEPSLNTVYVVSRMVKDACPGRNDVMVPADLIRDSDGQVIGCRRLSL